MAYTSSKSKDNGKTHLQERPKIPVYTMAVDTGNEEVTFDVPMRELLISNDSIYNLVFQITGPADLDMSFTLYPGDVLDERFPIFNYLKITCSGAWRYIARTGSAV
jgi:hypothetical protein